MVDQQQDQLPGKATTTTPVKRRRARRITETDDISIERELGALNERTRLHHEEIADLYNQQRATTTNLTEASTLIKNLAEVQHAAHTPITCPHGLRVEKLWPIYLAGAAILAIVFPIAIVFLSRWVAIIWK